MGVFNISGLSSGIDTEEIVGKLLEVEKKPLLNLQVEHKVINAKLPIIQDVNFKLIGLKTMMKDLTYETPFATKKISSSVSSSVSATISGKNAVDGNYVIDSVSKIATASITRSQATVGGSIDINEKISSAIKKTVDTGTFSINSYSFGVNSALDSMQSVINNINAQTVNTGVEAVYDSLKDNLILKNAVSGNKNTIVLGSPEDSSNFLSVVGLSGAFQDTGSEVSSTTIKSIGHLGAVDSSKLLSETNFDRAFIAGNIKINGVEINVFASDTLNALITRINNSNANVTANYDTATDKFNLSSKNSGASYIKIEEVAGGSNFLELTGLIGLKSSTSISQTSGSVGLTSFLNDANLKTALVPGTLQIAHGGNTYTINYDETKTFQNLTDDINALDPNISASYDAGSGKFYIKPSSNSSPNITLTDLSGNLKSVLNFGGAGDNQSIGENAEYKINGITYKSNSNVINDKFNDISFNLTGVSSTSVTLNVSNDATVAKKNIEKFVELYNELITELDKQLKDEKSPVFRDNTLKDVFDGLKKFINRYVANGTNYRGLSDIGITTGAAGMVFNDDYIGKLEIDTSILDSVLESNPGDIRKLFAYDPDGGNKLTDGIAYHFNNYLDSLTKVDGTINKVIGVTNRELMRIAGNIIDWNDRVKIIESGLRTKFNSMEVLLGQVKRQGESLSQSLSKLG